MVAAMTASYAYAPNGRKLAVEFASSAIKRSRLTLGEMSNATTNAPSAAIDLAFVNRLRANAPSSPNTNARSGPKSSVAVTSRTRSTTSTSPSTTTTLCLAWTSGARCSRTTLTGHTGSMGTSSRCRGSASSPMSECSSSVKVNAMPCPYVSFPKTTAMRCQPTERTNERIAALSSTPEGHVRRNMSNTLWSSKMVEVELYARTGTLSGATTEYTPSVETLQPPPNTSCGDCVAMAWPVATPVSNVHSSRNSLTGQRGSWPGGVNRVWASRTPNLSALSSSRLPNKTT
mmetsp:Transcript_9711/g.20746  ORF Transcript_9711/g.20746 Transcript_9711/m.20746 type:complete len:288 (+) Transcript_9711:1528-2391(+)